MARFFVTGCLVPYNTANPPVFDDPPERSRERTLNAGKYYHDERTDRHGDGGQEGRHETQDGCCRSSQIVCEREGKVDVHDPHYASGALEKHADRINPSTGQKDVGG